jgi:ribosomal-protein-alanine N-acetyltransferase
VVTTLEGERVVLRALVADDAPRIAQYWRANAAHLAPWTAGSVEKMADEAHWAEKLERMLADPRHRRFAMLVRESAGGDGTTFEGLVNLHDVVPIPVSSAMLGYSISERFQGKGLMREALALLIRYAFDHERLHKVYASYDLENARSAAVLRRLGFVVEGRLHRHLLVGGEWRDLEQASLINDHWTPP